MKMQSHWDSNFQQSHMQIFYPCATAPVKRKRYRALEFTETEQTDSI